jgi:glutamate dehydrogenase
MAAAPNTDASPSAKTKYIEQIAKALVVGALPGETDGFVKADRRSAAELVLAALESREGDAPAVRIESATSANGRRMMRVAVANDDMPFLVDSIADAIGAHGLTIDRILHPVVCVTRDRHGRFAGLGAAIESSGGRTSLIYMETERGDARLRHDMVAVIETALGHVRAAVTDWSAMQAALAADAERQGATEGSRLMNWLLDRNFTLLGSGTYPAKGSVENALGIAAPIGDAVLAPVQRAKAHAWLTANEGPMLVKSNWLSTVHRRAPLDLIVVAGSDTGAVNIHAGLWTSAALAAAPHDIPVLRQRLDALMTKYDFPPDGHAGKALAHALTSLPHDVLLAIDTATLERLALTAMSLADRPRAELVLTRDALDRHMFAFVWLPRDELTTARRVAIADMIATDADGVLLSWSIDLGDGEVAMIRYTFDRRQSGREPDEAILRAAVVAMVRGWSEAVEASLMVVGDAGGATRLALRYADAFPVPYRSGAGPEEAALDILRLARLDTTTDRQVRLYRNDGDGQGRLRLKLYSLGPVMLSDVVPALENFGFRVVEEVSTILAGQLGHMHRFVLDLGGSDAAALMPRRAIVETAIATVLDGGAENDRFNELVVAAGFEPRAVVLLRALFRYLRQTGLTYGLVTVVDALRRHPHIARAIVDLFGALHEPSAKKRDVLREAAETAIEHGLSQVAAIDEDRVLRLLRAVVRATLRTNFYAPAGQFAIAFKFDSAKVPGLPAPVPWREIWVYSPRVEGIHLRAGPVARGGLRWSDRRDDFRTEILGLMKAQRVKNAVIVPTGAKGGFFPKALPNPAADRDAWLAEGTESYRLFIRTLLSVTDNIVDGNVVHPEHVVVRDGSDPYFVVAADKGTATFSDVANAIALERHFWLGDAFASGGSVGYDHKAMGITAKGAWISVQRHFAELGTDVQTQSIRVVGCGDMSGDVFGNGMLLSKSLKIVAAFDHRHIFIDPDPDPAASWDERARLFALPRSSWADYEAKLISKGGGVFARSAKSIRLSKEARAALDIAESDLEPAALISGILKSPVDLIWFGGIGTYVKAASETDGQVGDPANDILRVDAEALRARAIGEGANLGVTQAARIAFSLRGGRINTDFIDNSAGVDCSDHEVNIKIALNAEVNAGNLSLPKRNVLLSKMTDQVADLVLEDNRLQTLALSIAERGGPSAVPSLVRLIETFEDSGRLDRSVEGLPGNEVFARRAQDGMGLTRPELAVLLATAKLALQDAIEQTGLATDPAMVPELLAAFPAGMRKGHAGAIESHQLRSEIVATKVANRIVNRMGLVHPFELAEEEGAALGDIAAAFVVAESLFDARRLWAMIDAAEIGEGARLLLFEQVAVELRAAMADLLRGSVEGRSVGDTIAALAPGIAKLDASVDALLLDETRTQARGFALRLTEAGAPRKIVDRVVRLAELDGAVGLAGLADRSGTDAIILTNAFTALGNALGIDWAQGAAMRATPVDPWERLLVAGLSRDFQQMRLEWLARDAAAPEARVAVWLEAHASRIRDFRRLVDRARISVAPTPAMLAQIAGQARVLLGR